MSEHSAQNSQDKRQRKRGGGSRTLTEILSHVIEPVLARKTGMKLDLLRAWPELAGEEFSASTRPEKIKWPKSKDADNPFEPGVLIVACEPACALFFQHALGGIVERVNVFFGFKAIARVKILQKPVLQTGNEPANPIKALSPAKDRKLAELISSIDDPQLQETLRKLGKGVLSKDKE